MFKTTMDDQVNLTPQQNSVSSRESIQKPYSWMHEIKATGNLYKRNEHIPDIYFITLEQFGFVSENRGRIIKVLFSIIEAESSRFCFRESRQNHLGFVSENRGRIIKVLFNDNRGRIIKGLSPTLCCYKDGTVFVKHEPFRVQI